MKRSIVLIALVGLSACASLARSAFATPTVELKELKVRAIGFQGGTVDVIVSVTNANEYRLDATHLTYNLWVDTNRVFFGEVKQLITLEPKRTTLVTIPVQFSIQELVRASQLLGQTGGVDYKVDGVVTAAMPGATITRPYKGQGHFDDIGSLKPQR